MRKEKNSTFEKSSAGNVDVAVPVCQRMVCDECVYQGYYGLCGECFRSNVPEWEIQYAGFGRVYITLATLS